jgi:hypothetical protein
MRAIVVTVTAATDRDSRSYKGQQATIDTEFDESS